MSYHGKYGPVGYTFAADNYCPECAVRTLRRRQVPKLNPTDDEKILSPTTALSDRGPRNACSCTECRLDRMAARLGIDRMDERSYDSGDFPKTIPYHNDLHAECGPQYYGYGPEDPEWQLPYCGATCGQCHEVIDGQSQLSGADACPAYLQRMESA